MMPTSSNFYPTAFPQSHIWDMQLVTFRNGNRLLCSSSGCQYDIGPSLRATTRFGGSVYRVQQVQEVLEPEGIFSYVEPPVFFAMKVYSKDEVFSERIDDGSEDPLNERACLAFLRPHANVAGLQELGEDSEYFFTIMELAGDEELIDIIAQTPTRCVCEEQSRRLARQIVSGLDSMHNQRVCHRDLSSENIVVSRDRLGRLNAKIIDFGLSLRVSNATDLMYLQGHGAAGKPRYLAPELYDRPDLVDYFKCDIWAFGVILCFLTTGHFPVRRMACPSDERYECILAGSDAFEDMLRQWNHDMSADLVDLLTWILQPLPENRPSLEEICRHVWMS